MINKCEPAPKHKRSLRSRIWWRRKDSKLGDLYDGLYETLDEDDEVVIDECRSLAEEEIEDICFRISEDHHECIEPEAGNIMFSTDACRRRTLSEDSFDYEMLNALKEAEEMIKNLLLKGCPAEMILSWINQSVKLSRLKITKQFKIYLTDYENEEIKMGPLPKTVFLFFLRHPEGVMFSHLQDYREELKMIYGHVCTNDDPQRMEESINRLTDPFDNSICEKCANVKKAFLVKVADNIAANYYSSIGRQIDIIKLNGSIELAPILGLSDVIVDIVETGTTLKENDLEVIETIVPISARLIANKASYQFKRKKVVELMEQLAAQTEDSK